MCLRLQKTTYEKVTSEYHELANFQQDGGGEVSCPPPLSVPSSGTMGPDLHFKHEIDPYPGPCMCQRVPESFIDTL